MKMIILMQGEGGTAKEAEKHPGWWGHHWRLPFG